MDIPLSEITIGKRHRKDCGDVASLAASIEDVGLLQPIVLTAEKRLVAGFRRIKAFKQLGREKIPAVIARNLTEAIQLLKAERDENTCRLAFTVEDAVSMRNAVAQEFERIAKLAQAEGSKKGGQTAGKGRPLSYSQTLTKPKQDDSKRSSRMASEGTGFSATTLDKAEKVVDAAAAKPEFRPLVDEMNRTGKVNGAFKKLQTAQTAEAINSKPPPLPDGKFHVIVADPPWLYFSRAQDPSHRAANPYPAMSVDKIMAMPVCKRSEDDSILWLWTTNAFMVEAHKIAEAWGFKVKTILTWAKDHMGMGDWLRGQTEHCLMCVRGKPVVTLTNQTTILHGKAREHSRKPDEFYELVEGLCPGSKCELFSRGSRDGWQAFGAEVGKFK